MQAVRHAVHTLKSSSASIGAMRLSRLCAEIEAAVRQEAFAGLPALLDDVDRELAVVLQAGAAHAGCRMKLPPSLRLPSREGTCPARRAHGPARP